MYSQNDNSVLREIVQWWRQSRSQPRQAQNYTPARVLGSTDFRVVLELVTGDDGDETAGNTYQYNVKLPSGKMLMAGTRFVGTQHDYETYLLGSVKPATMGQAYYNENNQVKVYLTNERLNTEAC